MGKIVLSLLLVIWLTIHFLWKQIPKGRQLDLTLSLLQTTDQTVSEHHQMFPSVPSPTSQLLCVRAQWPLWKSVSSLLILEITWAFHWLLWTFQEDTLILSSLAFWKGRPQEEVHGHLCMWPSHLPVKTLWNSGSWVAADDNVTMRKPSLISFPLVLDGQQVYTHACAHLHSLSHGIVYWWVSTIFSCFLLFPNLALRCMCASWYKDSWGKPQNPF